MHVNVVAKASEHFLEPQLQIYFEQSGSHPIAFWQFELLLLSYLQEFQIIKFTILKVLR